VQLITERVDADDRRDQHGGGSLAFMIRLPGLGWLEPAGRL
jgi:hypothetical protein